MENEPKYAHTPGPTGEWQPLSEHLLAVARLAESCADPFDAGDAAYFLGLCHDVGKYAPPFQHYLRESAANPGAKRRGPDHKAAGAVLARKALGLIGLLVQAHHGGLQTPGAFRSWLAERTAMPDADTAISLAQADFPELATDKTVVLPARIEREPLETDLFIRLLFSTLVDADFLDTEAHFQKDKAAARGSTVSLKTLWERFAADQAALSGKRTDDVGRVRHAIYEACLTAAELPPGLFRLSVPTGGGKTRSAMAFALRHALRHGQQRVIVAVPFISITEQTADVYRRIFGADDNGNPAVLEHHSGAWEDHDDAGTAEAWSRIAAENWDAPIVVTTTVQLFESLFSANTGRARKLHRLARSVIILDEAQALPTHLLQPILGALRDLCLHYGTTVVMSTATQPAFASLPDFANLPAREIVPDPARYFAVLRRVEYKWRTEKPASWVEVASWLGEHRQALAVLNTKKDALALLDALGDPNALHLSTLLCGAHRRQVIGEVHRRLAAGEPCRLISTQVIEAGVDLDFPFAMRALGPLDAVIQAAGRCNREGRHERGQVLVFLPEGGGLPLGAYRTGTGVTGALLGSGKIDPDDPTWSNRYFEQFYRALGATGTDRDGIQGLRQRFDFPETSRRFRMIAPNESVVVPYGSEAERHEVANTLDRLSHGAPDARRLLRRLQPYLVSLYMGQAQGYRQRGFISPVMPGLGEWHGGYDPVRGLIAQDPDADSLVV